MLQLPNIREIASVLAIGTSVTGVQYLSSRRTWGRYYCIGSWYCQSATLYYRHGTRYSSVYTAGVEVAGYALMNMLAARVNCCSELSSASPTSIVVVWSQIALYL